MSKIGLIIKREYSTRVKKKSFIIMSIRRLKKEIPQMAIMTDVALDPYTTHGHDGVIINNKTIKLPKKLPTKLFF